MAVNLLASYYRGLAGSVLDLWLAAAPAPREVAAGALVAAAVLAATWRWRCLLPLAAWFLCAPLPFALWPEGAAVSRYYYPASTAAAAWLALAVVHAATMATRSLREARRGPALTGVLVVLVAASGAVASAGLHRTLAIQYAYSADHHFKVRRDLETALRQYDRSLAAHAYEESGITVCKNRASALLLSGRLVAARDAYLDLLHRAPGRRDLYEPALRAYLGAAGFLTVAQALGAVSLAPTELARLPAHVAAAAAQARTAGDTARAAGLDRLRRHYFP